MYFAAAMRRDMPEVSVYCLLRPKLKSPTSLEVVSYAREIINHLKNIFYAIWTFTFVIGNDKVGYVCVL